MIEILVVVGVVCVGLFVFVIVTGATSSQSAPSNLHRTRDIFQIAMEAIPGITEEDTVAWRLVRAAKECLSFQSQGIFPPLDDFACETLPSLYGDGWLTENEQVLQAMLVYVDEFRMMDTPDLQQFFVEGAMEDVLLCIAACMQCLGIFTTATLPKGKPCPGDFILAFSGCNVMAIADPQSTTYILHLALRFASETVSRRDAV